MIETATEYLGKERFSAKYLTWKKLYMLKGQKEKRAVWWVLGEEVENKKT